MNLPYNILMLWETFVLEKAFQSRTFYSKDILFIIQCVFRKIGFNYVVAFLIGFTHYHFSHTLNNLSIEGCLVYDSDSIRDTDQATRQHNDIWLSILDFHEDIIIIHDAYLIQGLSLELLFVEVFNYIKKFDSIKIIITYT